MRNPKHVAETLKSLLSHPVTEAALDRTKDIQPAIEETLSWWGYDLFSRKPSPAYDEYGVFKGTDLDLACFLYSLVGRNAVINLPVYKSRTKAKVREDQELSSKYNRNGQLVSVSANKNFFSFNISIIDQNVVGEDKVGDFRTFSLTDYSGQWYDGWKEIQFVPTLHENKFITENKLWSGHKILFKHFVHPNRWTSFFGHYYAITKILMERLEEEAKYYNSEVKAMLDEGIKFPPGDGPKEYGYSYGEGVQKKFTAFETMIYIPESRILGEYPLILHNQENLIKYYRKRKEINSAISRLRFMTRATEYAHYTQPTYIPGWLQNVKWESSFSIPGKRIKWDRLKLFQPVVGEHSVSILKRTFEKSTTVSAE